MKSHWEQIKLADLFELQMGKTPAREKDQYWRNGNYKWVSIADIGKFLRYTEETKEKITDIAISESGIKQVPANTLIMSFKLSLGKVAITSEPIYTNEAIMAFIDRKKRPLALSFLFHLFKNKDWSAGTNKAVLGMTLNKATLKEISIPVPPLPEQEEIAQKLDAVCRLITLREQQLKKLDQLASSRFIEMFGGYEKSTTMSRYIAELRGGKSLAGTVPCKNKVLKTGAATFGYFDSGQYKYLPLDYVPLPEHKVEKGDVIISRMNTPDLVGACSYVFDTPDNMYYPDRLWKTILKTNTNPIFLWQLLWEKDMRKAIKESSGGTSGTMHNISKQNLLAIRCIDVPLELQNEFAAFVEQLDKSKVTIRKSIEKLETTYRALLQEYFG